MAVTLQNSVEYTNSIANPITTQAQPHEAMGRLRIAFFNHIQDGAGDATSSVALCKLPAGKLRLLSSLSRAYVNWTTGSATLDLGWDAHTNADGTAVAADPNGLVDGLAVDTAAYYTLEGALAAEKVTGGTHVLDSQEGVVIRATSQDTAIVSADDLVGYLIYVID